MAWVARVPDDILDLLAIPGIVSVLEGRQCVHPMVRLAECTTLCSTLWSAAVEMPYQAVMQFVSMLSMVLL
jgi:hypothetical protein